jgi:hypothetical protein
LALHANKVEELSSGLATIFQGGGKVKEGYFLSTITLEAAADYNLWFWHAAYGFSGALNESMCVDSVAAP